MNRREFGIEAIKGAAVLAVAGALPASSGAAEKTTALHSPCGCNTFGEHTFTFNRIPWESRFSVMKELEEQGLNPEFVGEDVLYMGPNTFVRVAKIKVGMHDFPCLNASFTITA